MARESESHYRGEAGRKYQQEKRAVPVAAFPWVCRLRAEKFQPYTKPTDTVVEFGAGLGWNLAELKCARKIATDLENHLEGIGGVEFVGSSREIPRETADVVICHHVLEHVANPTEMLREARRVLKANGLLILHVPYEIEGRYRAFNPQEPNHHLYSWNVQTLGNLVITESFTLFEAGVKSFGYDRFAANLAVKFGLGELAYRGLRRLALLLRPGYEVKIIAKSQVAPR